MDRSIIDRYEAGASSLKEAIAGLSMTELLAVPLPGKWSLQQVVIHLLDSDLAFTERMKRIIAEDKPTLLAFDQEKWLAHLHYNDQPAKDAAELFELNRRVFATVLRRLPGNAFDRIGLHSERGPQSLRDVLSFATSHLNHHLKFVVEKRERLLSVKAQATV